MSSEATGSSSVSSRSTPLRPSVDVEDITDAENQQWCDTVGHATDTTTFHTLFESLSRGIVPTMSGLLDELELVRKEKTVLDRAIRHAQPFDLSSDTYEYAAHQRHKRLAKCTRAESALREEEMTRLEPAIEKRQVLPLHAAYAHARYALRKVDADPTDHTYALGRLCVDVVPWAMPNTPMVENKRENLCAKVARSVPLWESRLQRARDIIDGKIDKRPHSPDDQPNQHNIDRAEEEQSGAI